MLHALALTATLLILFLSFGQMARDIMRYVLRNPHPAQPASEIVVVRWVRAPAPSFTPAGANLKPMPLPVRPVSLAA